MLQFFPRAQLYVVCFTLKTTQVLINYITTPANLVDI